MSEQLLKQIARDVTEIKKRMRFVEEDMEAINPEMKPEYVKKLKEINKERFLTRKEFDRMIGE